MQSRCADACRRAIIHYSLKQRVGGRYGHLNNDDAAALLARLDNSRLQHIVAAHLSRKNNAVELAVEALSEVLGCAPDRMAVATQEQGLDWREIILMVREMQKTKKPTCVGFFIKLVQLITLQQEQQQLARKQQEQQQERKQQVQELQQQGSRSRSSSLFATSGQGQSQRTAAIRADNFISFPSVDL